MIQYVKDGVPFKNPLHLNGRVIFNPTPQELIDAGYTVKLPKAKPRKKEIKFSKLKIIELLGDKWTELRAQIEELGLLERFNQATYLSLDNPDFRLFFQTLSIEEKKLLVTKCRY